MAVATGEKGWRNFAIIMSIVAVIISCLVFINHKESKPKEPPGFSGKMLIVSKVSQEHLSTFMLKNPNIVAISTVSISLTENTRHTTYFHSKDAGFQREWLDYMARRTKYPAVFSDERRFNTRITSIINGRFECRPTDETVPGQLYNAGKYAPIVCAISVPVAFDESTDFVGYINIFLKSAELSDSDKARLGQEAVKLSTDIYNRDLK